MNRAHHRPADRPARTPHPARTPRPPVALAVCTLALAGAATLLTLTLPAPTHASPTATPPTTTPRLPVERAHLLCPAPTDEDRGETLRTALVRTPPTTDGPGPGFRDAESSPPASREHDTARLTTATTGATPAPVIALTAPGRPGTARARGAEAPALVGTATGRLAPGFSAHQTTLVPTGKARGLLGLACVRPGTDLRLPGTSTAAGRRDTVHLVNPDETPAVVDLTLTGPEGALDPDPQAPPGTAPGENLRVPPHGALAVAIADLTPRALADLTLRVTTRVGRVGAAVRVTADGVGTDWLTAAEPGPRTVLPGIPADATAVRLILQAPGTADADLRIRLAGRTGTLVPAEHEEIRVPAGATTSVDLGPLTRGETGTLLLDPVDPANPVPVVAALRVVRGAGAAQEIAFVPGTAPLGPGERATLTDNRAPTGPETGTTLALTAPDAAATVLITPYGPDGPAPDRAKEYTVPAGTTLAVTAPPTPPGLAAGAPYALTVTHRAGGPVHGSRALTAREGGVDMITITPLADDHATVPAPRVRRDLGVLTTPDTAPDPEPTT
ncbi:DUF5719 family protein [Streptomyces sp. BI20]|uniref:DUF5719 family protein n=1 Tax=Streptomyces sp. BI20 TaxID=3403460 RepID=UPI003C76AFEA